MRLIDIVKKDVSIVLRDWKALIFIVLMPIVLMSILGLALGGVFSTDGFSIGQINIAVVDDTDELSQQQMAAALQQSNADMGGDVSQQNLSGLENFDQDQMSLYTVLDSPEVSTFITYEVTDLDTADALLADGEIAAVVHIPKSFALDMMLGMVTGEGHAQIDVTGSADDTMSAGIVSGVVSAYTDTISQIAADIQILIDTMVQSGKLTPEAMQALDIETMVSGTAKQSAAGVLDIAEKGVAARNPIGSFAYYSIAITCMFVLYSAGQGSTFLYTEDAEKTLMRLRAAGISRTKLLLGKSVGVLCLTVMQLIILFVFSTLAFGLEWGSVGVFVLISLCVALSVTGLGVLLMVLVYRAGNPRIGNIFQSIIVQVLALFGGSYLPLSQLPKFFSTISLATPNGLAIHAYTENITGAPAGDVLPYMLGSLGLGVLLFLIGMAVFPRERRA